MASSAKKPAAAAAAASHDAAVSAAKPPALPAASSRMARIYGAARAAAIAQPLVNDPIKEVDGASQVKISNVPRSTHYAINTSASSGTIAFRGQIIGKPRTRSFSTNKGGSMTLVTVLIKVLSDVPRPDEELTPEKKRIELPSTLVFDSDEQMRITTKDQTRTDVEDPHMIRVVGQGKPPPSESGSKNDTRAKILRPNILGAICAGAVIEITVNAQKLGGAEPEKDDVYDFQGVTYKAEQGANKSGTEGGRDNSHEIFRNWEATAAVRVGKYSEAIFWPQHNKLCASLAVFAHRNLPLPIAVRNPDFDLATEQRRMQEEKRKKSSKAAAAKKDTMQAYGVDDEGAGEQQQQQQQHQTSEGDAEMAETDDAIMTLADKEKNELARRALTPQARGEFQSCTWTVPLTNINSRQFCDYLTAHKIPHNEWYIVNFDSAGQPVFDAFHDPTARQNFVVPATPENVPVDASRKPEIIFVDPRPVGPEEKPARLCPVANLRFSCLQPLPSKVMPGEPVDEETGKPTSRDGRTTQSVDVSVRLGSHSLLEFGIQEPRTMGLVLPSLLAATPGLVMCYPTNTLEVVHGTNNPAAEMLPQYRLSGCVTAVDRNKDGTMPKHDVPAIDIDLAVGVINAGYPITHEAAIKMYQWANKTFERSALGKVSATGDMTHSSYSTNAKFYCNTTHLKSHVINCWETRVNYANEGKGEWRAFVVPNFAQKPSRYEAEMSALYEALKTSSGHPMTNACKLFGKLMVDLANKTAKLGLPQGALDTASPDVIAANTKATEEYAAALAKEGGLAKFPFAANMLHRVFGPLHPSGHEPDFSEATGLPFHCAMYAIRLDYLEKRRMLNYIGDDFMNDVILPVEHAAYAEAAAAVNEHPELSYAHYRAAVEAARAGTGRNPAKGRKPPASGEAHPQQVHEESAPNAKPPAKAPAKSEAHSAKAPAAPGGIKAPAKPAPPAKGAAPAAAEPKGAKVAKPKPNPAPTTPVAKVDAMDHTTEESHAALDPTTPAAVVSTPMTDAFGEF